MEKKEENVYNNNKVSRESFGYNFFVIYERTWLLKFILSSVSGRIWKIRLSTQYYIKSDAKWIITKKKKKKRTRKFSIANTVWRHSNMIIVNLQSMKITNCYTLLKEITKGFLFHLYRHTRNKKTFVIFVFKYWSVYIRVI